MPETNVIKNFTAGGVGGACTVIVGYPFDTIKVRLQAMTVGGNAAPMYSGTFDCFKQTVTKEGFRGLYKGMAAPLAGVCPLSAIFFGGYSIGQWLQRNEAGDEMTLIQNANAGALAGLLAASGAIPGERIKCLLQIQTANPESAKYSGPFDVVKKLYKEGGIKSIYRGTVATLLRDIPASAAYFSVYGFLKKKFAGKTDKKELTPGAILLAGGFAGIANWAVCMPADVLKSRLQTAPEGKYSNGLRDAFKEVIKTEGPSGLFKGFTIVMLRAFPANAACFFGVELTLSLFQLISS